MAIFLNTIASQTHSHVQKLPENRLAELVEEQDIQLYQHSWFGAGDVLQPADYALGAG